MPILAAQRLAAKVPRERSAKKKGWFEGGQLEKVVVVEVQLAARLAKTISFFSKPSNYVYSTSITERDDERVT